FILVQAILALTILTALGAGGNASDTGGFFWWILTVALFIGTPLRGFNALSSEDRLKTMDIILLTRLTAWRITFGKWAALVSQSALFVASVLPYVVLRYFLGGVNVLVEVAWVVIILFISAILTAITVGFSAHKFFLIRGTVAIGVIILGFTAAGSLYGLFFETNDLPFSLSSTGWLAYLGSAMVGLFAIYYVLDMGATFIAPAAENHATRKRLSSLAVISLLLISVFFGADPEVIFTVAAIIGGVVCFDALTETPNLLPSIFAPFVRKGVLVSLTGRFLYPGWHSAVWFTTIIAGALALYAHQFGYYSDREFAHTLIAVINMFVFPLAIIQLFFRKAPQVFAMYVLIQCITALFSLLIFIIAETIGGSLGPNAYWIGCFLPLLLLIGGLEYSSLLTPFSIVASSMLFLSVAVLITRSIPILRRTSEIEREIAARLNTADAKPQSQPPSEP
ncbi:MAG: hypothetical protein P8J87_04585, partial [Verrucomicrobiales bacterium]|nr:hypothetical protein [Verrucomicrobiales bacterium]